MGKWIRFLTSAAASGVLASSATIWAVGPAAATPPAPTGPTRVPLRPVARACDFTELLPVAPIGIGVANALIRRAGSGVAADVQLVYGQPDSHYDVGLIQAPRPSSENCGPGDPGTAFGSLNTDGAGSGAVTVQDGIRAGTTGVWVTIKRPSDHSQDPAEFYNADFIAPV